MTSEAHDTIPCPPPFRRPSALALLRLADAQTRRALAPETDQRARLVHCRLAQRYTLQALAVLRGPCGVRLPPDPPRLRLVRPDGDREAVLP